MNEQVVDGPKDVDRRERERQTEEIRNLYQQTPASLVAIGVGLVLIITLFVGRAPTNLMYGWLLAFLSLALARVHLYLSYRKFDPTDVASLLRWRSWWNALTIVSGLMWGTAVVLFYDYGDTLQKVSLVAMIYGYSLGSIQLLASQFPVFLAFCAGVLGPTLVRVAWGNGWAGVEFALIILMFFALTTVMGRNYKKVYDGLVDLKFSNEDLLARLREEKEVAEEARYRAEVANGAKSQFFAAASHDLRQPLHAVSLYTEALRMGRSGDPAELVESISKSVSALDSLFAELLDVSKIDSGAVVPQPRHFLIGELFASVEVHTRPVAFEKGLDLKFHGELRVAHADPNLLERVVRNLISNAIRYTEEGGVLVTCRRRSGRLLLQVWDSGAGIAEDDRERIFEEFYQVSNSTALPPNARRGMGLGLAIVRRLIDLMGLSLELRTRPGHGSVFGVLVPEGDARELANPVQIDPAHERGTLAGRLFVVVDDDPDVRESMVLMLQGWGGQAVAFKSAGACREWAEQFQLHRLKPDLAIVDYALDGANDGIDAIRVLREQFGADLPIIVVTGGPSLDVDADAREHHFHAMTKPVLPHKLRSVIGFKLGSTPDASPVG